MRTLFVRRSGLVLRMSALGLGVLLLGALSSTDGLAQPTVDLGGTAFLDYSYVIDSFDEEEVGYNTFDYRRIYLTADYTISESFDGRVRLEAAGRSTTAQGRPAPFVKDLYLRWNDVFGEGHRLTFGVQSPPLFDLSESTWGYRSLEKTIIDRVKVSDSRDMGLRADGPILPNRALRYSLMVGNGNGVQPEPELETGKHVYGQLQIFPGETVRASIGTDYKIFDGEDDSREGTAKVSAFVGAVTDRFRAGVEGFYLYTTYDDPMAPNDDGVGISVFGAVNFSERTSAVARYDYVDDDAGRSGVDENYGLVAFVYRPDPHVELMPNLFIDDFDGSAPVITGRFTVHVRF